MQGAPLLEPPDLTVRRRFRLLIVSALLVCGLVVAAGAGPAQAAFQGADVTYSPRYWELLERYASVEIPWAPVRGAYPVHPECTLRQQQGEAIGCQQVMVIMTPDASLGGMWVADTAAPDGWRPLTDSDCPALDDFDDPGWWRCYWYW